jgi:hypothetical protein
VVCAPAPLGIYFSPPGLCLTLTISSLLSPLNCAQQGNSRRWLLGCPRGRRTEVKPAVVLGGELPPKPITPRVHTHAHTHTCTHTHRGSCSNRPCGELKSMLLEPEGQQQHGVQWKRLGFKLTSTNEKITYLPLDFRFLTQNWNHFQ